MIAPFSFNGLESYTREEAALKSWMSLAVPGVLDWRAWMVEIFGGLLEKPAGREIRLTQTNCVDTGQAPQEHRFEGEQLLVGRGEDCDIVLPARAVGSHHARISLRGGTCSIEDLGSALGTHFGPRKLVPNQPQALHSGDSFMVFPYRFDVKIEGKWTTETRIEISEPRLSPMEWGRFGTVAGPGMRRCAVEIHPGAGAACLETSNEFLTALLGRAMDSLLMESIPALRADDGVFEFMLLALIERANRQAGFPLQFVPRFDTPSVQPASAAGLELSCTLGVTDLAGAIRLWLPYSTLKAVRDVVPPPKAASAPLEASWPFPISAGWVELSVDELGRLEPNDILLFTPDTEILFPGKPDRGWQAVRASPTQVQAGQPFQRPSVATEDPGSPGQLPLHLFVLLGHKHITLAGAQALPGSVIDLDWDPSAPVHLAVRNRVVGEGRLVEIDGKPGVQILTWAV